MTVPVNSSDYDLREGEAFDLVQAALLLIKGVQRVELLTDGQEFAANMASMRVKADLQEKLFVFMKDILK